MSPLILLCCLGALVPATLRVFYDLKDAETHFQDFIKTFEKKYSSDTEKKLRLEIFKKNLDKCNRENMMQNSHICGITMFSDLTVEEFKAIYLRLEKPSGPSPCLSRYANFSRFSAPEHFDWRQLQKVTRVKNQGHCGSCWAFSTVGNIEGQYAIVHNHLQEFSESQLVDCDRVSHGCDGGFMSNALRYVQQAGGLVTEGSYPYQPAQGPCRYTRGTGMAKVIGCNEFRLQSEDELKEILYQTGPLAITLSASYIQQYKGGIFTGCNHGPNDHAVLLVGYGSENGTPFWIIKNSWGEKWGEHGYIRLPRNINACNMVGPQSITVSAVVA